MNGTLTTHTLDVGLRLPEVIVEHDGGAATYYLHLPHSTATDGGAWSYGATDGLGSVRQRLDAAGQVVSASSYRPFGLPQEEDGSEPYGYTGEWWEDDAGLLYLRARYYDPVTGRFLSRDSWRGNVRQPGTLHRYVYLLNDPVNGADPSGHCPPGGCVVLGEAGSSPEDLARLEAAQQACRDWGLGEGCYLYEGAIWHNYFTSGSLGKGHYVNATGVAAGEEGAYRAAVAREWSSYAYGRGIIEGDQNLNWWPNARGATPAQRMWLMLAFAGPAAAEATRLIKDHFCTPGFRAVDLPIDIYPRPAMPETDIPFFAQTGRTSCGVACFRMAEGKLGVEVLSEEAMIEQLGSIYDNGISFSELPEAANALGLRARVVRGASITDLVNDFSSPGNVIILDVDSGIMYGFRPTRGPGSPWGHAAIITDIRTGSSGSLSSLRIHDPATGADIRVSPRLFMDAWEARFQRYAVISADDSVPLEP